MCQVVGGRINKAEGMRMTAGEIRGLIRSGKIVRFYKSAEWLALRGEVLEEYHFECQRCLAAGRVTRAEMVHHVNEVKRRPDLALCKTFRGADGVEHANLLPLCNECHNAVHDKLGAWQAERNAHKFTNRERW